MRGSDGGDVPGNYRDTVIYNTFVWMQLFNDIAIPVLFIVGSWLVVMRLWGIDVGTFAAEFYHSRIQGMHGRNIPKMCTAEVDHNVFNRFFKVFIILFKA